MSVGDAAVTAFGVHPSSLPLYVLYDLKRKVEKSEMELQAKIKRLQYLWSLYCSHYLLIFVLLSDHYCQLFIAPVILVIHYRFVQSVIRLSLVLRRLSF